MGTAPEEGRERPRLYLISPPVIDLDTFEMAFRNALAGGDVACFQLRLKDRPAEEIIAATKCLLPIAQDAGVAFLLNDDAELARDLDVDGVHVGQDDMPYEEARRILGPDAIIGVTCKNSRHLAMEAGEAGADYVAFGAFFPSSTKSDTVKTEPDILTWWSETTLIPAVAIGGITIDNAEVLLQNGADFLAVAAGVWEYKEGPKEAVAAFNRMIDKVVANW
ncbi:thiamine phosphate synthase [Sneathiella sp. CAU 1612]|uniref:Thiamine-phosphate synthase n=1 Tax=Sneathiella sedimenti TaxID=2816034 RepID=A0ABS3F4Y7_9PROT|nr:thiamine phosphate synthase [Sneathiella sedimenti]MBO0333407.1 thiamine phosphate synthase [Sneathiella sedimenti]